MALEIYLDVDGVCADLITAALRVVGHDPETTLARWRVEHPGEFYPDALIGMPITEFFLRIDALGAQFWMDLQPYAWFPRLYHDLGEYGHVVFLTATTGYPDCLAGKYRWLCRWFGVGFTDCIFTSHKDRLAHAGAVLIDDSDANIRAFRERGGAGIVFPQFWNSGGETDDPAARVIDTIARHADR